MIIKNVKHIFGDNTEATLMRLIADDDKILINNTDNTTWHCVDVLEEGLSDWSEINIKDLEEEATIEDYQEALRILGVSL